MLLLILALRELEGWLENIDSIEKPIALPSIHLEYFFSLSWGTNNDTDKTFGAWNMKGKALHINCKELLTVY